MGGGGAGTAPRAGGELLTRGGGVVVEKGVVNWGCEVDNNRGVVVSSGVG